MTPFRAIATVVLVLALQSPPACPIDGSDGVFTGQTKTDSATGKLLKEYECRRFQHKFWMPTR